MNGLRKIKTTLQGQEHGPITRLISPSDVGNDLKPFIFLDYFNAEITPGFGFPMHPHSGIATLTWQPHCDVAYRDTTGQNGTLKAGGLEWMNAGGGAWHQGFLMGRGWVTGFQLWVAMPPLIEDGQSRGQYIEPDQVEKLMLPKGSVSIFLGSIQEENAQASSAIESHQDMNYGAIGLSHGGNWHYTPPTSHDIAWAFVFDGTAQIQGRNSSKELIVFEGAGSIEFDAPDGDVQILFGTAQKHNYPLILGSSSVHTNKVSLRNALSTIAEIGKALPH